MHKFMLIVLRCVVGSFFLMMGIFVVGSMLQVNRPPHAYEDPVMTSINACYQKHERFLHAPTEADKGDVYWWCTRQHYRTNR